MFIYVYICLYTNFQCLCIECQIIWYKNSMRHFLKAVMFTNFQRNTYIHITVYIYIYIYIYICICICIYLYILYFYIYNTLGVYMYIHAIVPLFMYRYFYYVPLFVEDSSIFSHNFFYFWHYLDNHLLKRAL